MVDRRKASKVRQEIGRLAAERAGIERRMLRPVRMMPASLIKRHLGTHAQKRASAAFYLSHLKKGRTRLVHVPKATLEQVRPRRVP